MNIEQEKVRGVTGTGNPPQQGVADYPPKPVQFYAHGDQAGPGPGYPVSEAAPAVKEPDRLFCWGLGVGWYLLLDEWFIAKDGEELIPRPQVLCTVFWFIIGFILGAIPWYVGAIMLLCVKRKDYNREKPGYIACAIFAVIATVVIVVAVVTRRKNGDSKD